MVVQIVIADRKSSDSKIEAISELRLIEEDLLSKNIIISENELDFTRSGGFCAWRERIEESINEKNELNAQAEKCETNANETENSENETDSENSDSQRSESESSSSLSYTDNTPKTEYLKTEFPSKEKLYQLAKLKLLQ